MKVWFGYGSEHSYNLVMIGHFADAAKAKAVAAIIERIAEQARDDERSGRLEVGWEAKPRFSDELRTILDELHVYSLAPDDAEHFIYEYSLEVEGSDLVLKTDEIEIAAFLKLMIDGGAKVEVYSAHDYPSDGDKSSEGSD